MAIATYTTDLTTVNPADDNQAPFAWFEPTGSQQGGTDATELDYFIQGTACISKTFNSTGVGGVGVDVVTPITLPTSGAVFTWVYFAAPNALTTKALGGMQVLIGSSGSDYRRYYVSGSDTYQYGGWVCYPVDPRTTPSATQGTPTTSYNMFGMAANVQNPVFKGNPCACDAIRAGRGKITVINGELGNYGNFAAAATFDNYNDATNGFNRFGILSLSDGIYKFQGMLEMGTAVTAVDFRDSNKTIVIQNTEYVAADFNSFTVNNAASSVNWQSISVTSLGTVSRGDFVVNDNATVNLNGCVFTNTGTFTLGTNTTLIDCVFRNSGVINHNGASIIGGIIAASNQPSALLTTDPTPIQDVEFVGGTGHGIEITQPGTYGLDGIIFTDFGADETTSAAVYNNSGGLITLNVTSGGTVPTVRNSAGSSTIVNAGATLELTGLKTDSEIRIYLGTDPNTATEVAGTESSGTTFVYAHTYAGQQGYIQIFHVDFQPITLYFTFSGLDVSLPIQQFTDRQYTRGSVFTPG